MVLFALLERTWALYFSVLRGGSALHVVVVGGGGGTGGEGPWPARSAETIPRTLPPPLSGGRTQVGCGRPAGHRNRPSDHKTHKLPSGGREGSYKVGGPPLHRDARLDRGGGAQ